jgi:hypothetical protein
MNWNIELSPKRMFIILLFFIFIGCVYLYLNKSSNKLSNKPSTKEGLDEIPIIDSKSLLDIPKNASGVPDINLIPAGYYKVKATKMGKIPYGYKAPDKVTLIPDTNATIRTTVETNGLPTNNQTDIPIPIPLPVPGGPGDLKSRVPNGYYLLDQTKNLNQMATIPPGYTVGTDKITLQIIDTTYKKITDSTPDYHASEAALIANEKPSDAQSGIAWVKDMCGNMVPLPKSSVQGDILYYTPGSYPFGPSNYVPKYEDSVFLSRITGSSMTTPVYNAASLQGGFCSQYKNDPLKLEEICRTIDNDKCGSTNCCVLLGGSKCVAGDTQGPTQKSNYADVFIRNRDYYYYQGKCFGNCPDNP